VSYLAIARKYRPTTFSEIVGQEHVTRTLANAIARGRVHHAYLFCGARGVGKTTAARALAQALNCERGPTIEPCGVCPSCVEIRAGSSPDLIEIDGASNNSVDNVRELRETVRYAPQRGARKIYLVDEVHMLSNAAFNALLKTLEEPPPHVVFIFATTEPQKIPDTILSRVQRFDFKRIPAKGVVERLGEIATSEGATISEHSLRVIARAGEGSMRDAQSLLDKVLSFAGPEVSDQEVMDTLGLIDPELLHKMLRGMIHGNAELCLDTIDHVYQFGFELSQFTHDLLGLLRDVTFLRLSKRVHQYVDVSDSEKQALVDLGKDVPPERLTRMFHAMLDVHDQVSRAARPRVVLEMAVARLAWVRPVVPMDQMLKRLDQMERRLRSQGGRPSPSGRRERRTPPDDPDPAPVSGSNRPSAVSLPEVPPRRPVITRPSVSRPSFVRTTQATAAAPTAIGQAPAGWDAVVHALTGHPDHALLQQVRARVHNGVVYVAGRSTRVVARVRSLAGDATFTAAFTSVYGELSWQVTDIRSDDAKALEQAQLARIQKDPEAADLLDRLDATIEELHELGGSHEL